jgi:hypothetical protein
VSIVEHKQPYRQVPSEDPVPPRRGTRRGPTLPAGATLRLALLCALIAGAASVLFLLFGPPGIDRAAHVYHTSQFEQHGWQVWNNYWYAGRYELVNYSIIFYPLAAWIGLETLAVLAVAGGAAAFAGLARAGAGRRGRPAALVFAFTWPVIMLAGQYPFALGAAFAMTAMLALVRRHHLTGLLLVILTALTSPLSFLLLTIVLAGAATGARGILLRSGRARVAIAGLFLIVAAEVIVVRLFPVTGTFPFPVTDLVAVLVLAVAGIAIAWRDPVLRSIFAAYGLLAIGVFAFPSGIGGNMARVADYAAVPLLLLAFARRGTPIRLAGVLLLIVVAVGQAAPVVRMSSAGIHERADNADFWAGAIAYLQRPGNADPNYRVEAVATFGHWEAYHLAKAGIPLTRGWFRQDDFPINQPLYNGALEVDMYVAWLRSLGVRYVVLPRDELDYSTRKEAAILANVPDAILTRVYGDLHADIFELRNPTPLLTTDYATGGGTATSLPEVVRFDVTALSLWLPGPGVYSLRVRYTPFWTSSDPDAVCVGSSGTPGVTRVVASRGGPVNVAFDLTLAESASQALGAAPRACPAPPPGAFRGGFAG